MKYKKVYYSSMFVIKKNYIFKDGFNNFKTFKSIF